MMADYADFLVTKRRAASASGFDVNADELNPQAFDWQRDIVTWACKKGRAALFADTGLGKTLMQLMWAQEVSRHTGGDVLILAPLAVAAQTKREGAKFGIDLSVCRKQSDVRPGINVTNYEVLHHFEPGRFAGVVLDESSILKAFMGKTKQAILRAFDRTPFKLACTATPSPNDHLELGNHAEFLGVMPSNEMIMRWFINDTMAAGSYRLKGHAERDFWRWVSSWAVSLSNPSDLGYSDDGFGLPALNIETHVVEVDATIDAGDALFRDVSLGATTLHKELRLTAVERAAKVAEVVGDSSEPWLIWCNTNYEADALRAVVPHAVEVRGSDASDLKERRVLDFLSGKIQVLISKPSIFGFGLNFQHCRNMAFVGLSYSYEEFYQAVRRSWRFGQKQDVNAHVVMAETEGDILKTIQRKQGDHERMKRAMQEAMNETRLADRNSVGLIESVARHAESGRDWQLYQGDCVELCRDLEDESIGFSIFSPPFEGLYIYSDALADMGNCAGADEFFEHFRFLIRDLHRVTMLGRLCAVHCKDLPLYKGRDGASGLRDFPGEIVRAFTEEGWTYHSKITIWKDPVIEMQRTKNHGLLYKNLRENSCVSRQGMADYVVVFRKWIDDMGSLTTNPVKHNRDDFPLDMWQEWASPVWMNINQTNVLNNRLARDGGDEKHICPLQLDVIERCLHLWSNRGDTILSPFAGIGSEGVMALRTGRKFVGFELKPAYFMVSARNLHNEESQTVSMDGLLDGNAVS